ncbi:type II secretion system F family protein [Janthinobacterium fluminis]|uniref:Type II secretion system F family protein n=1 Tax=Janthinobacterium fluminis TaxID=2987524 RepID=A0ABT5K654_9BURK|nr:type II secretion system F family protein [Janthinobacterium fluminis]MDC8760492.1 type II secretion system F family protein [Janthinobacterium fluminis]
MDLSFYGFTVLLFAACFLLVEGAWLWWSATRGGGARHIARRLRLMSARGEGGGEKVSILKQRRYSQWPAWERLLRALPHTAALDRLLLQSGTRWSVLQLLAASALSLAVGAALALWYGVPALAGLGLSAFALALPYLLLLRARAARLHKIEGQLPEAADFLARALRAGHSFSNVLQMVGDELPEPISGEFKFAHEEINYGVPMNEALQNLAARVPLTDLRYMVIAVLIQRESGGNLAELLGSIGRIIRERLKLLGRVRVLSAEGKMSAWILGLMPVAMMAIMSVVNPDYIRVLWTDPAGVRLLWYSVGMVAVGVVWMRNVIRIRV